MAQFLRVMAVLCIAFGSSSTLADGNKRLAYVVSDLQIPFWQIMERGIRSKAESLGYQLDSYSSGNDTRNELTQVIKVLNTDIDGLILSPTNSSAAVTLLRLAEEAGVPVVIADIGTQSGKYVSYIASDNFQGSYELGKILNQELEERGWLSGSVGIIGIPQTRANGRARTNGFMVALAEKNVNGAGIRQQRDFSYKETYDYAIDLIKKNQELRAIWLQGSDKYQGALDAIKDMDKSGEILLLCFDAEPEFLDMIPKGQLLAAGMQQPFLMGEEAVIQLDAYLHERPVEKTKLMPVLPVSRNNINSLIPTIRRNVLGQLDNR